MTRWLGRLWRFLFGYPVGRRFRLPFGRELVIVPCADPDCRFVAMHVFREARR